jgi:hypothetical protein
MEETTRVWQTKADENDTIVPVSLDLLETLQKRLQKAEEINEKMLTVILEQSEHIRYLEALGRVKRL